MFTLVQESVREDDTISQDSVIERVGTPTGYHGLPSKSLQLPLN